MATLAGQTGDDDKDPYAGSAGSAGSVAAADEVYAGADTSPSSTPTTITGQAGSSTATASTTSERLPKRPFNPLSKFASSTYNIALYMLSPDAHNRFVRGGKRTIRGDNGAVWEGIYTIAQSGGININVDTRPPGMTMDYYLDNLKFKSNLTGPGTTDASNVTEITFNIYEPLGFSFVTKLTRAAQTILANSKLKGVSNTKTTQNSMRQFFVLGISFAGYTSEGEIGSAKEIFASDTFTGSDGAVYERYLDIIITKLTFNLDGNMVNYSVTAAARNTKEAQGTKYGVILERAVARGATVEEALLGSGGIIPFLNEQQEKLVQQGKAEYAIKYAVKWVNDPSSEVIKNARLITKQELADMYTNKIGQVPMTEITKANQVNDAASVGAKPGDSRVKELHFEPNTAIGAVIQKLMQSSTYLADALAAVNQSQEEPEDDEADLSTTIKTMQWYSLGSQLEVVGWDEKRNDWVYAITYVISPYKTPCVSSVYAPKVPVYYGPHKRYDYWFTGKNTEVIRYSQSLNTAWYMAETSFKDAKPAPQNAPVVPGQRPGGNRLGAQGTALDPQNSFINSLYAPADWALAKLEILGDPDYLMYDTPGNLNEVYSPFYAGQQSFTINPSGGQVFIEINFVEGVDYNHDGFGDYSTDGNYNDTGTLTLNNQVLFWDYKNLPESVRKRIKGISYMVRQAISTFSRGKFTQELMLNINTFPNFKDSTNGEKTPEQRDAERETRSLLARYPSSETVEMRRETESLLARYPTPEQRAVNSEVEREIMSLRGRYGTADDDSASTPTTPLPAWQNERQPGPVTILGRDLTTLGGRRRTTPPGGG